MNILKKAAVVAASAALVFANAMPALASYKITISGNGSSSDPDVTVNDTDNDTVTQSNNGNISTTVNADADTGDNDADDNTGGSTSINTGKADVTNTVTTVGHLNGLTTSCGCSSTDDVTIDVLGNGSSSTPDAVVTRNRTRSRNQTNTGTLTTSIPQARSRTGRNNARRNTGGTVTVTTDDAEVTNTVDTTGHENTVTE